MGDENDATLTRDASGTRRWRLISRLHDTLSSVTDLAQLCGEVAATISEEIRDGALVVLRDPNEPSTTIRAYAHSDAAVRASLGDLLATVDDGVMSLWLDTVDRADSRVKLSLLMSYPDEVWAQRLVAWRLEMGFVDVAHVPLRHRDGALRGMLVCGRDAGSPDFSELDLTALVSASDTISLGLAVGDLAEQRRKLLAELISAEQDERQRIANDVHDDALQLLAASQLRLQMHVDHLRRGDDAKSLTQAEEVAGLVSSAQRHLRHLLLDLEPPSVTEQTIHELLTASAQSFFGGAETHVAVYGALTSVPDDVASVFLRTGREAMSNARRHAKAANVTVELNEDDFGWRMTVRDDGVGVPDPIPVLPGHLGVRGMASRAQALGGAFTIGRRSEGGTTVQLEIPRLNR